MINAPITKVDGKANVIQQKEIIPIKIEFKTVNLILLKLLMR